ncbi:MAG TPA: PhoPQ-activated protein PqaA family protein [Dyella sp.]|uniref:PhoPQ-activated protein PqaA family protein n=1 Tax=Dyella sp. TaxID=1869338 RepID=UPI002F958573
MAGSHFFAGHALAMLFALGPSVAQVHPPAYPSAIPSATQCLQKKGGDWTYALPCYVEAVREQPLNYRKAADQMIGSIQTHQFELHSQSWSPEGATTPSSWLHSVSIFIPQGIPYRTAILVIDGGTRHPQPEGAPPKEGMWSKAVLAQLAERTQSVVVHVSDVPNQYLQWADGIYRTEDGSVAHSWALALREGPEAAFASLHLPMAAAAIRAMDLAEHELTHLQVNRFIVTGISKRGWATWFTALADDRVAAIAPAVIEVLDTNSLIERTRRHFGGHWPVAFYDYASAGVLRERHTPAFARLMKLEDPLEYLSTAQGSERLSVPKYIISASGDDFFLPDSARHFISRLPGPTLLRAIPQADHEIGGAQVPELIVPFVKRIQNNLPLPHPLPSIDPTDESDKRVIFNEQPSALIQWTAFNPRSRDFRYACGIRYEPRTIQPQGSRQPVVSTGWTATFVEARFADGLSLTSPIRISPDTRYPQVPPANSSPACSTLPDS